METRRSSTVLSVVGLVGGFVLALGLALASFATSLCSLWGEQCTSAEVQQAQLLMLASIGVFFGVPVAVAIVRRQARWLLAPVVEVFLFASIVVVAGWF